MRPPQPLLTRPLPVLILISLLAILIYSNTFSGSFHFDDTPNIVENPKIKHLENFLDLSGSRYVGFLTFALNYHFGGLHIFGYHLVNLLIHITNGFLVYSLVLLLFRASRIHHPASIISPLSPWVALATALLFIAHPLQTQAVTYIVQRFASLAALFYLLAVVCYLKWRLPRIGASSEGQGAREVSLPATRYSLLWYAAALLSTVLAMKTKENSFTLPFMILLVEAVFFRPFQLSTLNPSTSLRTGSQLRLVPFLLTLPIIPLSISGAIGEGEAGLAQETTEISRGDYLFTQFRVIVTYIRLLFLPIHQNLDYDYPLYRSLLEPQVFFSFLFLSALLALSLYLLFRSQLSTLNSQLISFGILWFFLTLSVESSIIPIRDVIFEHRLYLPSVGFFLSLTMGAIRGLEAIGAGAHHSNLPFLRFFSHPASRILFSSLILFILSVTTYQRNLIWKDTVTLWEDVVRKAPMKARGHISLAAAYFDKGMVEAAVLEAQGGLQLKPNNHDAYLSFLNLGNALASLERFDEAIVAYQNAIGLRPNFAAGYVNLGAVYKQQGRLDEAIEAHQAALRLDPNFAIAYHNLGTIYRLQGHLDEAIEAYQAALRLNPDYAHAYNNLGIVYKDQGHLEEAIREFQTALQLQPDYAQAHNNLGLAYRSKGMLQAARSEFEQALRIKPDLLPARQALESLRMGR